MSAALKATSVDEERRIRQGMRVDLHLRGKKSRPALWTTLMRNALLLTGGFCLGWGMFRLRPRFNRRMSCF